MLEYGMICSNVEIFVYKIIQTHLKHEQAGLAGQLRCVVREEKRGVDKRPTLEAVVLHPVGTLSPNSYSRG